MVIINMLYKKIFHVILLCKEKPPTRHLERSETKSKDLNYCLFTNNNISERNVKMKLIFIKFLQNKNPKNNIDFIYYTLYNISKLIMF